MTIQEAIRQRHAVRSYTDQPLPQETITQLEALIAECNREGGLPGRVSSRRRGKASGL